MATKPVIVTTWRFGVAASALGYELLASGARAVDAIEAAANVIELNPEVNSVGYGGLPNAEGVVELDAAIMDGPTHSAGAVGAVTGIRTPISLARRVMEQSPHTMLVGENAVRYARAHGFIEEELLTDAACERWLEWQKNRTAADVAHFDLGPREGIDLRKLNRPLTPDDHDTIGLCALDAEGNLAAGCTTSGMAWKTPGRVGDSPVIGSGLYVDNVIGAAAGTGHGDEMMKACLSYRVVQEMERGLTPTEACVAAIRYLLKKRPPELHNHYGAARIAVRKDGLVGAAATRSGFQAPDRLWQWAVGTGQTELREGPYATETELLPSLV